MDNNKTKITVKSKEITENSKTSTLVFVLIATILVVLMIGAVVIKGRVDHNAEQERKRRQLEEKAQEFYDEANKSQKELEKLKHY